MAADIVNIVKMLMQMVLDISILLRRNALLRNIHSSLYFQFKTSWMLNSFAALYSQDRGCFWSFACGEILNRRSWTKTGSKGEQTGRNWEEYLELKHNSNSRFGQQKDSQRNHQRHPQRNSQKKPLEEFFRLLQNRWAAMWRRGERFARSSLPTRSPTFFTSAHGI